MKVRSGWVLFVVMMAACNLVTGADGLRVDRHMDDDDDDGVGGQYVGAGGQGAMGLGGGGGATTTTPPTGGNTTTTTGSGGATTTAPEGGSGGEPPPPCTYPSGPYGVGEGDTVAPTINWQCIAEGASSGSTIHMEDYFDCDGSKDIDALLVETTQYGCGACAQEAQSLEANMQSWANQGLKIRWVAALLDNADNSQPPTIQGALTWRDNWGLDSVAVCADPYFSMVEGGSVGTPMLTLINPRNMQVVDVQEGYSGNYSLITQLAQQNAVP